MLGQLVSFIERADDTRSQPNAEEYQLTADAEATAPDAPPAEPSVIRDEIDSVAVDMTGATLESVDVANETVQSPSQPPPPTGHQQAALLPQAIERPPDLPLVGPWSAQWATLLRRCERETNEVEALRQALSDARSLIEDRDSLLERLVGLPKQVGSGIPETDHVAITSPSEALRQEVRFVIESGSRELERAVEHQAQRVTALEDLLERERAYHVEELAAAMQQQEILKKQLEESHSTSETVTKAVQDAEHSRVEASKAVAKCLILRDDYNAQVLQCQSLKQEVLDLRQKVATKEKEISSLRDAVGTPRDIRSSMMLQVMERQAWGGRSVAKAATAMDGWSLRAARLLFNHAGLRLAFILYVIILHVYVGVVLVHVLHQMPTVGDDVHDHVANHLA